MVTYFRRRALPDGVVDFAERNTHARLVGSIRSFFGAILRIGMVYWFPAKLINEVSDLTWLTQIRIARGQDHPIRPDPICDDLDALLIPNIRPSFRSRNRINVHDAVELILYHREAEGALDCD